MSRLAVFLVLVTACLAAQNAPPQAKPQAPANSTAQPAAAQPDADDDVMIDMSGGEPIPTAPDPPKPAAAASTQAKLAKHEGPHTVRWKPPTDGTMADPAKRRLGRMIASDGIKVIAGIADYEQYNFSRIDLQIVNESGEPIHFDPAKVTLVQTAPQQKALKRLDPVKIARGVSLDEYSANQADLIPGMDRATLNPGLAGRSVSASTKATIRYNGQDYTFTEFLRQTRLKPGELQNSTRAVGGVYFELAKKRSEALLRVPIGQVTFEIPFEELVKN